MAYVTKCDICGEILVNNKDGICLHFRPLRPSVCAYTEHDRSFDLCRKCVGRLNKAMQMLEKEKE